MPDIDASSVTLETNLREDLGMDSLGMMMVSMEVEDAFGFHFTQSVEFNTVGDVFNYLKDTVGIKD